MSPGYLSPNHGDRRGLRPEFIVLHYTAMTSASAARDRLCDPQAEVSAHWLIAENGTAEALVPEDRRAWHAGAGSWRGLSDMNSRSIGIEIANPGDRPFTALQMDCLTGLLREILARWPITSAGIIGHSDMAPGRKFDPGPRFDWQRLAREDLAIWPTQDGPDCPLAASLDAIGYADCDKEHRLHSFRLRFRPWACGPETVQDRRCASAVAQLCRQITPG